MTNMAWLLRRLSLFGSFALSLALAGCGVGTVSTAGSEGTFTMSGRVHGGVQPIAGASIQLFSTGTAGNGAPALNIMTNPVFSGSNSYFTLTGNYQCPTATSQVYLVARGGNPGLSGNVNNTASVLLAALGNCGALISNPNRFISVNEVTTVAAAYALAQFATGYDHISSSATNTVGVTNAFLDAALLADTSTGMAAQLPTNLSIEAGKLYALADAIVPCVNSSGGSACTPLFTAATPANGTAPTDTFAALLNIIKNPGTNVRAVYNLIGSTPPYPTTLTQTPNDWTLSMNVTGGGIVAPTAIGLDGQGNVWVTNDGTDSSHPSGLVGYTPQGTPLPGTPYGVGVQTDAEGLTIDKNGDVWVASLDNTHSNGVGSVAKFHGVSTGTTGALIGQFLDSSLFQPIELAADPAGSGSVLAVNFNGGTVTVFNLDGTVNKVLGSNLPRNQRPIFPESVISDGAGGAWVGDHGDANIDHLLADGTIQRSVNCCDDAISVALDTNSSGSNVWATNFDVFSVTEVAPNASISIYEETGGGLYSPGRSIMDAGGDFWVLDYYGNTSQGSDGFTEIAASNPNYPAGTFLSPSTAFGRDANMSGAYSAAVDASGNLWMAVDYSNSVRVFFGIATPTAMPATPIPQAP
jgi:hypothetical protein